jgi:hypothetical protein
MESVDENSAKPMGNEYIFNVNEEILQLTLSGEFNQAIHSASLYDVMLSDCDKVLVSFPGNCCKYMVHVARSVTWGEQRDTELDLLRKNYHLALRLREERWSTSSCEGDMLIQVS